ncbi:MAG TPA: ribonuclease P protein subunit [Thermoplasmata archaeon]|nr:ribonuclease P protein subunit [Thermoplasmata archaeon]
MSGGGDRTGELGRAGRDALAGELIGATVALPASRARAAPIDGTIVDETLSTFVVRVPGRARLVRVPKAGLEGTIVLDAGELPLRGELLRVRPEDRTKRLLTGGPRRFR